ncbi:CcdB family protein [Bartonella choladocola]|uniref:Toxin CcdB n=1 Tax=Bartonella choladocola TaxID=2750995 RepID=A0A1U9MJ31_9HYPH|nr:CcdB family protein [Bartonella choladocola]AQT47967.1 toxin CcdB [Bartonella choladocola]
MVRFDVYKGHDKIFFLIVQADLLNSLKTKIVVPLVLYDEAPKPAGRLNPIFKIGGERYVMLTQFISSVPIKDLQDFVTNLSPSHDEITRALDTAFQGF